jgi:hypothetical protein
VKLALQHATKSAVQQFYFMEAGSQAVSHKHAPKLVPEAKAYAAEMFAGPKRHRNLVMTTLLRYHNARVEGSDKREKG